MSVILSFFFFTFTFFRIIGIMLTPSIIDFGEIDFTGRRLALHSMPMFHGMGIMQTGWTVRTYIRPYSTP